MGLLGSLFGGMRMKDPVQGTAQIVSCTGYRGRGVMQNCRMQLVVQAEGVEATAVEHSELVHNQKWPAPGMTLPATIDRSNPNRVKLDWDAMPSSRERSQASAESIASAMRAAQAQPEKGQVVAPDDSLDQLQQLADLHERGALTDAEFKAQKRKILGD